MIDWKMFWCVLLGWLIAGYMGYKYGDFRGYEAGYNEGYLYDCREEINVLYDRVRNQTKALNFTDSAIKFVIHQNDSLMRKEYYQKRYLDSLNSHSRYSIDSLRYHKVAKIYSDSLNKAVGGSFLNIIQADGQVNRVCALLPKYRDLVECKDGFDIKSRLDIMLSSKKKKK